MKAGIRRLSREIVASLKGDQISRLEIAREEVDTLFGSDPPNLKEAWRRLKGWYNAAVNRVPLPA